MAQEFSNPENRFCTHQKWAGLQALTLPKQSDFTHLSDDSKAYNYIYIGMDAVCRRVLPVTLYVCGCASKPVCSGVPVGGYRPSHGASVFAQPSLFTYTG